MGKLLFGVLVLLLPFTVPICVCIGYATLAGLKWGGTPTSYSLIVQQLFVAVDNYPFMAVPFFMLAGDIMQFGGISERLVNFIGRMANRLPARLAVITTISSAFFAAISGSNPATVAAIGGVMKPSMLKQGYSRSLIGSIIACSGCLGVVIPPSISMVTYSLVSQTSVGDLFVSGILPGLIMMTCLICVSVYKCSRIDPRSTTRTSAGELLSAFREAIWAIMMPVIILGGIYSGMFTPTEAAAVSCVYAFFVSKFVFGMMTWKDLQASIVRSSVQASVVFIIIGMSASFSWLLTASRVPAQIVDALLAFTTNKYAILMLINLVLLFEGCFMSTTAIIILMTPLLVPICNAVGIDLVTLGIVIVVNTSIGMVTPPVAVDLYVAASVTETTTNEICKELLPYFLSLLLALALITYIPGLCTFMIRG